MTLALCDNQTAWEPRKGDTTDGEFLQSWEWGEFQRKTGKTVFRFLMEAGPHARERVQGFGERIVPTIRFVSLPRIGALDGPSWVLLMREMQQKGYAFARIEPAHGEAENFLRRQGFSVVSISIKLVPLFA